MCTWWGNEVQSADSRWRSTSGRIVPTIMDIVAGRIVRRPTPARRLYPLKQSRAARLVPDRSERGVILPEHSAVVPLRECHAEYAIYVMESDGEMILADDRCGNVTAPNPLAHLPNPPIICQIPRSSAKSPGHLADPSSHLPNPRGHLPNLPVICQISRSSAKSPRSSAKSPRSSAKSPRSSPKSRSNICQT
jgi:hypothetical protein